VGSAMRNNPIPFVIPCHRVVAAGHKIGGYGGGRNAIALKRELLAREGVSRLR
jgi:methylated-DNA-[protein]-cysteine S-methyltransferase